MLGKFVSMDELKSILVREEEKDNFQEQLESEVRGIKKGECLRYECKEGGSKIQRTVFILLIADIKGLKLATSGNYAYVYRE